MKAGRKPANPSGQPVPLTHPANPFLIEKGVCNV